MIRQLYVYMLLELPKPYLTLRDVGVGIICLKSQQCFPHLATLLCLLENHKAADQEAPTGGGAEAVGELACICRHGRMPVELHVYL